MYKFTQRAEKNKLSRFDDYNNDHGDNNLINGIIDI